jgi:hypothetical protein
MLKVAVEFIWKQYKQKKNSICQVQKPRKGNKETEKKI